MTLAGVESGRTTFSKTCGSSVQRYDLLRSLVITTTME